MLEAKDIVNVFSVTDFLKLKDEVAEMASEIKNAETKNNLHKKLNALDLEKTLGKLDLICLYANFKKIESNGDDIIKINLDAACDVMLFTLQGKNVEEKSELLEKVQQGDVHTFLSTCAFMTYITAKLLAQESQTDQTNSSIVVIKDALCSVSETLNQKMEDLKQAVEPFTDETKKWVRAVRSHGPIYAREFFRDLFFRSEQSSQRRIKNEKTVTFKKT
jgi:hypothetical protein